MGFTTPFVSDANNEISNPSASWNSDCADALTLSAKTAATEWINRVIAGPEYWMQKHGRDFVRQKYKERDEAYARIIHDLALPSAQTPCRNQGGSGLERLGSRARRWRHGEKAAGHHCQRPLRAVARA